MQAITGLLQGDIDLIAVTTGPITARIRGGEFRALAVTSTKRWRDLADVPTVAEQGVAGFEVISWTGLAGPAKLPEPIINRLNAEMRRTLAVPEVKTRLENMGGDPTPRRRPTCARWYPGSSSSGGASRGTPTSRSSSARRTRRTRTTRWYAT